MSARVCGDCSLCCKVMAIGQFEKPAGRIVGQKMILITSEREFDLGIG